MSRLILPEASIHSTIRAKVAANYRETVEEVAAAVEANRFVVVGMKRNPHCATARKALTALGASFKYLEYGGYAGQWRRRNALKMWCGWPTFPMVFVDGALVGGATELQALIASGDVGA